MAALTLSAYASPDLAPFVRHDKAGIARLELAVKGAHCANCIARIESGLKALDGVSDARLNLSTGKLSVRWRDGSIAPSRIVSRLAELGFSAQPYDPEALLENEAEESRFLLRCLAVTGFAAANVMLLSVSVWSGLHGDMGEGTRTLFHWISALIAIPAALYGGRPFFRSARRSLAAGRANMDVPISLAILLALALSVYRTILHAENAYFDAAVTLAFLLLIGRYLDHLLRRKARSAARALIAMQAASVRRLDAQGNPQAILAREIAPGDRIALAAGERTPVDGTIEGEGTDADLSLVTGESAPVQLQSGAQVSAGAVILGRPIVLKARARVEDSLVAELARLLEASQQARTRYVRLADRAAQIYVPAVHSAALTVFIVWFAILHAPFSVALTNAIALLIITCPCALGLAVPAVQIVATGRLFRRGLLVKTGDALERLAEADVAVFDKTGTLTMGRPQLQSPSTIDPEILREAAMLARASRHPFARALATAAGDGALAPGAREIPGCGVEAVINGETARLGSADWINAKDESSAVASHLWYRRGNAAPVCFAFSDPLRPDAEAAIKAIAARGLRIELLSGDRAGAVAQLASSAGIANWHAAVGPEQKVQFLDALRQQGKRVLMAGDGLNDAAALAHAHVSVSPGSAIDATQAAADMILQGDCLMPLAEAIDIARRARRRVLENFAFTALYNAIAIPLAAYGLVTPFIAAIAMASSSLFVTLNALRLRAKAN